MHSGLKAEPEEALQAVPWMRQAALGALLLMMGQTGEWPSELTDVSRYTTIGETSVSIWSVMTKALKQCSNL